MKCAHQGLRAFVHFDCHRQAIFSSLVIVCGITGDLDLFEAVCPIQVLQSLDVIVQHCLVVASVGEQASGRLNLHAGAEQFITEVLVAGDLHLHQLMDCAGSDFVGDAQAAAIRTRTLF